MYNSVIDNNVSSVIDSNITPTTLIIIYFFASFISSLKKLQIHDSGVIRVGILTFMLKLLAASVVCKTLLEINLVYWILVSVRISPLNDIFEIGLCYFSQSSGHKSNPLTFIVKYLRDLIIFAIFRFIAIGIIYHNNAAQFLVKPYALFITIDTFIDFIFILATTRYICSSPCLKHFSIQQIKSHVMFKINIILRNNFIYSFFKNLAISLNVFIAIILVSYHVFNCQSDINYLCTNVVRNYFYFDIYLFHLPGSNELIKLISDINIYIKQSSLSLSTFLMILASQMYSLSINTSGIYFMNQSTGSKNDETTESTCKSNESYSKPFKTTIVDNTNIASFIDNNKFIDHNQIFINNDPNSDKITDKIYKGLLDGSIKPYSLESKVGNFEKAVHLRRKFISEKFDLPSLEMLPYVGYDYGRVYNQCAENVVGFASLPIGIVGPLNVNGHSFWIPLATTEGCLIASINRGISAIRNSKISNNSISAVVLNDAMTRCPVIKTPSLNVSYEIKNWLTIQTNYESIKKIFEGTSRFCKLIDIICHTAGNLIFLRFSATTGEAMGMNMISKATQAAVYNILQHFSGCYMISLSGNMCADKKSAAINWINGRGKSVSCETIIDKSVVKKILKVENIDFLVEAHISKNYVGSAMSGTFGGFNAHASNCVAAIFAATGQDLGQIVESSNCITIIEKTKDDDLYISCTMPSIEVGTIGGGTILPSQKACLNIMNVYDNPIADPSKTLSMLICSTVLAGELSLISSLVEGTLVQSHLKYNRSNVYLKNS